MKGDSSVAMLRMEKTYVIMTMRKELAEDVVRDQRERDQRIRAYVRMSFLFDWSNASFQYRRHR